jgi:hypothetical protein
MKPKAGLCVVFTTSRGNRSQSITDSLSRFSDADLEVFEARTKSIVQNPEVTVIIIGGALGGDTVIIRYALKHRLAPLHPEIWVVVPMTIHDQPAETWRYSAKADRLIELGQPKYDANGYFRNVNYINRDKEMLRLAKQFQRRRVQAFWTGQRSHSGTYATITLAKKMQIPVDITWLGKRNKERGNEE